MATYSFHQMPPTSTNMALSFGIDFEDSIPPAFTTTPTASKWENKSSVTKHRDTYSFIDPYRFQGKLSGKVVLITQAHRGIGRSTAVAFAQAGASVCCVGPTAQSLEAVLLEIKEKWNTPTLALAANLVDPRSPAQLVAIVEKYRGPVDILINISTSGYLRGFAQEPNIMQDWWPHLEDTLRLPISLIHAVLPSMIERNSGIIISTTLASGVTAIPFLSAEGVAKAALIKFHHHLEAETRSKGIVSFAVNPGPVPSHLHDPASPKAVNPEHTALEPEMQSTIVALAGETDWAAAGLASGTFLALCAEPRTHILSGMYVNAERNIEEVILRMEKDRGRKVERDKLYRLKVDEY